MPRWKPEATPTPLKCWLGLEARPTIRGAKAGTARGTLRFSRRCVAGLQPEVRLPIRSVMPQSAWPIMAMSGHYLKSARASSSVMLRRSYCARSWSRIADPYAVSVRAGMPKWLR